MLVATSVINPFTSDPYFHRSKNLLSVVIEFISKLQHTLWRAGTILWRTGTIFKFQVSIVCKITYGCKALNYFLAYVIFAYCKQFSACTIEIEWIIQHTKINATIYLPFSLPEQLPKPVNSYFVKVFGNCNAKIIKEFVNTFFIK